MMDPEFIRQVWNAIWQANDENRPYTLLHPEFFYNGCRYH
jgi:hypothetical protein